MGKRKGFFGGVFSSLSSFLNSESKTSLWHAVSSRGFCSMLFCSAQPLFARLGLHTLAPQRHVVVAAAHGVLRHLVALVLLEADVRRIPLSVALSASILAEGVRRRNVAEGLILGASEVPLLQAVGEPVVDDTVRGKEAGAAVGRHLEHATLPASVLQEGEQGLLHSGERHAALLCDHLHAAHLTNRRKHRHQFFVLAVPGLLDPHRRALDPEAAHHVGNNGSTRQHVRRHDADAGFVEVLVYRVWHRAILRVACDQVAEGVADARLTRLLVRPPLADTEAGDSIAVADDDGHKRAHVASALHHHAGPSDVKLEHLKGAQHVALRHLVPLVLAPEVLLALGLRHDVAHRRRHPREGVVVRKHVRRHPRSRLVTARKLGRDGLLDQPLLVRVGAVDHTGLEVD
eukprot:Rhum_TRINITY_DN14277_c6_g1::Rhum_TRINITY_DN14277_c6_g1_i1::g.77840::m.77840